LIARIEYEADSRLESYRHVGDPRWLAANDLFVVEGRLVVERLIASRVFTIESVLVTPAAHRALEPHVSGDLTVYLASQSVVNGVTGFNFHRGCLALAKRPQAFDLSAVAEARRLVVLEGVSNPDNVGGVFRSAAALGADGVMLDPASGDPLYRKSIRTSMGAVLRLPFVRLSSWPEGMAVLRQMGYIVVALTPAGTHTIDAFAGALAPGARVAVLAGAEGTGLTEKALAEADATVRIPIDPQSDSLNVVVAVSIALQRMKLEAVDRDRRPT
jgi:tRNA G18 (ribose-2'-O)-methylase SpoU